MAGGVCCNSVHYFQKVNDLGCLWHWSMVSSSTLDYTGYCTRDLENQNILHRFMANCVKIVSWNVRGLNNKHKRLSVFQFLKHSKPHISFLQETHLDGSRILALRRPWVQKAFHATYSTFARGVSILISKALPCTIHQVFSDQEGRYVAVLLDIFQHNMILANVYLPPPIDVQVLYDLFTRLAPFAHLPMVLMGDFNAILDALDSSNPSRMGSADILSWASMAGLTELRRAKNPLRKAYSHVSITHRSSARIDLAFGNQSVLTYVKDVDYLAGGISDHCPLSLNLNFSAERGSGGWRLSPGWLQNEQVSSQVGWLLLVT